MAKEKYTTDSVISSIKLALGVTVLSDSVKKIVEISSYKHPEMLKSADNLILKENFKKLKK